MVGRLEDVVRVVGRVDEHCRWRICVGDELCFHEATYFSLVIVKVIFAFPSLYCVGELGVYVEVGERHAEFL